MPQQHRAVRMIEKVNNDRNVKIEGSFILDLIKETERWFCGAR